MSSRSLHGSGPGPGSGSSAVPDPSDSDILPLYSLTTDNPAVEFRLLLDQTCRYDADAPENQSFTRTCCPVIWAAELPVELTVNKSMLVVHNRSFLLPQEGGEGHGIPSLTPSLQLVSDIATAFNVVLSTIAVTTTTKKKK